MSVALLLEAASIGSVALYLVYTEAGVHRLYRNGTARNSSSTSCVLDTVAYIYALAPPLSDRGIAPSRRSPELCRCLCIRKIRSILGSNAVRLKVNIPLAPHAHEFHRYVYSYHK